MRYFIKFGAALLVITTFLSCGVQKSLKHQPEIAKYTGIEAERLVVSDSIFTLNNNFLKKTNLGLFEMYTEGNPLELGVANAKLSKELIQRQEELFFSKVEELVPGKFKQWLLRKFLAWYNRKLYTHIPEEFKTEIYGVSQSALNAYDYIAPSYLRSLYLHGAHDIGHALQDLALVGCTSFAAWGDQTADNQLLIGRNFDFYAGDEFARDKIVSFVNPDMGHKFVSITWGGMIGVVSGMNDQGITVTINAGKSTIPWIAKTPISLVTREILQYASTIQEAIDIAKKKEVFVSEAILVGSAADNKAVSIEISPDNFGVYRVENSTNLICSNHFQSVAFKDDPNNLAHQEDSHSQYRYERTAELLSENKKLTTQSAVEILRNKEGLNDQILGFGNEKALNQLLAHHAVVFQPEQLKIWVSSNPYQLGEFVCYDLNKVFEIANKQAFNENLSSKKHNIKSDEFSLSKDFENYQSYRLLSQRINKLMADNQKIEKTELMNLVRLNPYYWEANFIIGKYYYEQGYLALAKTQFKKALSKEVTSKADIAHIEHYIKKINRKSR